MPHSRSLGFSLVSVMVSVGILGIVLSGVMKMMDLGQKTSKSNELSGERGIMRQYIYESLSCSSTLPPNPSQACSTDPYLALKSSQNSVFLANNGANGAKLGDWMIRARCRSSQQKLSVEFSRRAADGSALKDPLTGRLQDWSDLFPGYQLCNKSFAPSPGATQGPVRTASMQYLGSNGCDTGGLIGGVMDVKRRYSITLSCAPQEKAVTGGAQCEFMKAGWTGPLGFKQTLAGKGSSLVASFPTPDGKSWYAECCVSSSGILGTLGALVNPNPANAPLGFVRCENETPL